MEFKSLKNIETSFRQIRLFGIIVISLCALVAVASVMMSLRFAEKQREKIYVLDNGKSLMLALSQDMEQNRPAEAREHVRRFHELFFTLSPDKSAIEHNINRAMSLADKSAYNYYSDYVEKGYYNRIIAGNISQVLQVDSIVCNFNDYPYNIRTYAPADDYPPEQRDGKVACHGLPPCQHRPLGRQSQRLHDRGADDTRKQRFDNHQTYFISMKLKIRNLVSPLYNKVWHTPKGRLVAKIRERRAMTCPVTRG